MRWNAEYLDSPPLPAPPVTRRLPQMSSVASLLALLLFSGSVIAQINGTGCTLSSLYVWVRFHDVSPSIPSTGRLTALSRHITRSIKAHVKWQHTCNPHATVVVSVLLYSDVLPSHDEFTVYRSVHRWSSPVRRVVPRPKPFGQFGLVHVQYCYIFPHECMCRMPVSNMD